MNGTSRLFLQFVLEQYQPEIALSFSWTEKSTDTKRTLIKGKHLLHHQPVSANFRCCCPPKTSNSFDIIQLLRSLVHYISTVTLFTTKETANEDRKIRQGLQHITHTTGFSELIRYSMHCVIQFMNSDGRTSQPQLIDSAASRGHSFSLNTEHCSACRSVWNEKAKRLSMFSYFIWKQTKFLYKYSHCSS